MPPKQKRASVTEHTQGLHNADLQKTIDRLAKGKNYTDQSTIIICPTRGVIPYKMVSAWMGLMRPMNQKVIGPLFVAGKEVGEAYHELIELIVNHPDLSKWKYVLTIEEDNSPPPDGLLKLLESIEGGVDGQKYDVVGGLYWTKGEAGQPMIYGNPQEMPRSFRPQMPIPNAVQPCNGLGMGFTLFRLACFTEKKLGPKPWFRTVQKFQPGVGASAYTQDLEWFERASLAGMRFASDNRVLVGHYDAAEDRMW